MHPYELMITAVRDRVDLLERTLASLLASVDRLPERVLVHEDRRPDVDLPPGAPATAAMVEGICSWYGVPSLVIERDPGVGLGRAVLALLEEARTEFVLYQQEDFDTVRAMPVGACTDLMAANALHHVRFNKRKTMRVKGEHRPPAERFAKREVLVGEQVLCVSDHWYFQASVWRRGLALSGFRELAERTGDRRPIDRCEARFNDWLNKGIGGGVGSVTADIERRAATVKTFIWGPVGEPAFIMHTGSDRRSQGWET